MRQVLEVGQAFEIPLIAIVLQTQVVAEFMGKVLLPQITFVAPNARSAKLGSTTFMTYAMPQ